MRPGGSPARLDHFGQDHAAKLNARLRSHIRSCGCFTGRPKMCSNRAELCGRKSLLLQLVPFGLFRVAHMEWQLRQEVAVDNDVNLVLTGHIKRCGHHCDEQRKTGFARECRTWQNLY